MVIPRGEMTQKQARVMVTIGEAQIAAPCTRVTEDGSCGGSWFEDPGAGGHVCTGCGVMALNTYKMRMMAGQDL